MICLFCKSDGPYSTVEHIVPESLGNKHLVLIGQVCDMCQAYLGKEVERYGLTRSPIGAWRVLAGIDTKHGKHPSFAFRQPKRDKGRLQDRHPLSDDSVSLAVSEEGRLEFDSNMDLLSSVAEGSKTDFRLILTPKMLYMMARFLGKVGLEMLARDHADVARSDRFNRVRRFVRFGEPVAFLWPIYYSSLSGSPANAPCEIVVMESNVNNTETYTLEILVFGKEHWITCLSNPYPPPEIRSSFPGLELQLITY